MIKRFTLNLGSVTVEYVAANELILKLPVIMTIDGTPNTALQGEDRIHQLSVLNAVPKEVRDSVTTAQPNIYIYNGKDYDDGFNNKV